VLSQSAIRLLNLLHQIALKLLMQIRFSQLDQPKLLLRQARRKYFA
jgi:hypothetical protein